MSLLQRAPKVTAAEAVREARELYGVRAGAGPLPSERDQNFLLESDRGFTAHRGAQQRVPLGGGIVGQ